MSIYEELDVRTIINAKGPSTRLSGGYPQGRPRDSQSLRRHFVKACESCPRRPRFPTLALVAPAQCAAIRARRSPRALLDQP